MLETPSAAAGIFAPVVVNQDSILVDGYRRYFASAEHIPVVQMSVPSIFEAAFQMNLNTRDWDDLDCFLWSRWAKNLNIVDHPLLQRRYAEEFDLAPPALLRALADRKILPGQALHILKAPAGAWPFFIDVLSSKLRLNVNETAAFIDMAFDLANRSGKKNLEDVFREKPLEPWLLDPSLDARRRGECLLKAMRSLRYPLYHRKADELTSAWQELGLQKWQAKKSLLLEKGVLEITIRARSQEDLNRKVQDLFESIHSPAWGQIWEI